MTTLHSSDFITLSAMMTMHDAETMCNVAGWGTKSNEYTTWQGFGLMTCCVDADMGKHALKENVGFFGILQWIQKVIV
jgi:hypothetical protein